jgi:tetratricopeptide (TPR) repeat protein
MGRKAVIAGGLVLVLSFSTFMIAQAPQAPLTEKEVIKLIKKSKHNLKDIAPILDQRGVDFDLDVKIQQKLQDAGADDETLQVIWKASPKGRASQKAILATATGTQLEIPLKEGMAYQVILSGPDPNRRIRMVDEFAIEFPNSQILPHVYAQGAKAYQEIGDLNKAVEYGKKGLKIDPENLPALLIVAVSIAQPSMLQGNENEVNDRFKEAEGDAEHVIKLLGESSKRTDETDEEFQQRKNAMAADAHFVLGMVALLKEDPGKAVEEFKKAIESTPNPTAQYYFRLGDACSSADKITEAIEAYKKASELGKGTVIEEMATKRISELKK